MKKQLVYPLIALLVMLGIAYAFFRFVRVEPVFKADVSQTKSAQLSTAFAQEHTSQYAINVQYPQFDVPAIDAHITGIVQAAIADLKDMSRATASQDESEYSLDGRFESAYIGPDVVSAKLVLSQYTGGAHPLAIIVGLNYDRGNGRPLGLEDALALTGRSLQAVATQAGAQLSAQLGEVFVADGARPQAENYSTFVISKDAVTFIFQPYQVAPYAAGAQEVRVARTK